MSAYTKSNTSEVSCTKPAALPFANHVLLAGGTNMFLALLALLSGVIVARLLGPTGRGELAAIQTWPLFIGTVAMLGLSQAVVYFSSRKPQEAGAYFGSAVAGFSLAAMPFLIAGYLLMPWLLASQTKAVVWTARCYLLIVPFGMLLALSFCPLQGRGDLHIWNILRLTPS